MINVTANQSKETKEKKKKALIQHRLDSNKDVVNSMKATLNQFSPHLRRDFLQILVRLTAMQFSVQTVRSDWRERKGMLAFLADRWTQLKILINQDTFFRWYCYSFPKIESILVIRNFVIFLYENWTQYKEFFNRKDVFCFIHWTSLDLEQILINKRITKYPDVWHQCPIGIAFINIIQHFRENLDQKSESRLNITKISTSTSTENLQHQEQQNSTAISVLIPIETNHDSTFETDQQIDLNIATESDQGQTNPIEFPSNQTEIIDEHTNDLLSADLAFDMMESFPDDLIWTSDNAIF